MKKLLLILFFLPFIGNSQLVNVSGGVLYVASSAAGCSDTNAQKFIDSTLITGATADAICQLVKDLKDSSLWTARYAIYPMVGGASTTCRFNLKDPTANKLTFNGTWTFSATGADPNGSTAYAQTGIVPSSVLALNDVSGDYYSRDNTAFTSSITWGSNTGSGSEILMIIRREADLAASVIYDESTSLIVTTVSDSRGFFANSRITSTDHNLYKNGVSIASSVLAQSGTRSGSEILIGCTNNSGTPQQYDDKECAWFSVGTGLTAAQEATLNFIVEKFQDALSRGVE